MTQTVPFRFHIEFSPHGSDGGLRYRARVLPEVSEVRRFELVQCSASQGPCHDPRSLTHSMPNQFSMPIHSLMHACIFAQTACSTYPLCMGMHSKSRISRFLLLAGSHVLPSPCPHTHPVLCRLSQYYLSPIPPSHTHSIAYRPSKPRSLGHLLCPQTRILRLKSEPECITPPHPLRVQV